MKTPVLNYSKLLRTSPQSRKWHIFILIHFIFLSIIYSQENEKTNKISVGFNYGQASQNMPPFDNPKYLYDNEFYKIQVNYLLSKKKKFSYELDFESGIFYSDFQYLNTQKTPVELSFQEYVVNVGGRIRYEIVNNFSSYIIGFTGPMYSEQLTNRLKDGFAFSNVVGLGFSYRITNVSFDMRSTIRHNSNANLSIPNSGHNSTGIEAGFMIHL